jgi:preprotein translocase subunit SecY
MLAEMYGIMPSAKMLAWLNAPPKSGFIPGVKPGRDTSEFIDEVLTRITLPGAAALALIAIFPPIALILGVTRPFSEFFGGTALIIMVGVVLDTVNQVQSYLLMQRYDGMMKTGASRGRTQNVALAS